MTTVYKVVRNVNGKLLSLTSFGENICDHDYWIKYEPNKEATPKLGKLFAFKRKKDAVHFIAELTSIVEVWRAKTNSAKKAELKCEGLDNLSIEEFWKTPNPPYTDFFVVNAGPVPKGTVFCSDITLIKKVFSKE